MPSPLKRLRIALKRLMPSNLFARALLILVLPMLISQLFLVHIFYDRHWSSVSRNMANSVVGDVAWLYQTYRLGIDAGMPSDVALAQAEPLAKQLNITMSVEPLPKRSVLVNGRGKSLFPDFFRGLDSRIDEPVALKLSENEDMVIVDIGVERDILALEINRKTLSSSTTLIFIVWMAGTSVLLTSVAILFLRNQIRPIVELSRVAEQLGLGQDVTSFKPRGASEVRRAGSAFLVMAERIRRQVQNRTDMLAGISHDLRTPLTRMKLELELATMDAVTRSAIAADIDEMGKMIDEYLDFARGDAGELPEPIELNALIGDVVAGYKRGNSDVRFTPAQPATLMLRPQAMRRALTNLIDNALRYGHAVAEITLEQSATFMRIRITDAGPGIPEREMETVFKPFTRLEPSRNSETGGVGLGLSIARSVAQGHGGDVSLENQRDRDGKVIGLAVTLRLPRAVQV